MIASAVIRAAREDEHALLTSLALRSKAHWGYSEKFMADCVDELTISEDDIREHPFFVLEQEGDVIGFCGLQVLSGARGELIDVFVEPSQMRRGHGRRLVEYAKQAARTRGLRSLVVEADPNAQAFYCSCGGRQIGTVPSGSIPGRRLPLIEIVLE